MNTLARFGALVLTLSFVAACDDTTGTGGAGGATSTSGSTKSSSGAAMTTTSGTTTSTTTTSSTTASGTSSSTSTGGSMCSGATPIELTVKNALVWCDVVVNGGAPSGAAEQKVCVAPGTYDLEAVAHPGFILGTAPWHNTDGDAGQGEQGNLSGSGQNQKSTAKITVSGTNPDCAWVCCPFPNGTGCPTTDQCP